MQGIRQQMGGYSMPHYVEEILTQHYCSNFLRMSIIKQSDVYTFHYRPDNFTRMDASGMKLYDKLLLLRNLINISENASEHLISAENYLLEPELVYTCGSRVDQGNLRLMFYPDIKKLDFRYKLVIFADRIMDRNKKDEREMAESFRKAAEPGDINRIKLFLDKNILRIESRMTETNSPAETRSQKAQKVQKIQRA